MKRFFSILITVAFLGLSTVGAFAQETNRDFSKEFSKEFSAVESLLNSATSALSTVQSETQTALNAPAFEVPDQRTTQTLKKTVELYEGTTLIVDFRYPEDRFFYIEGSNIDYMDENDKLLLRGTICDAKWIQEPNDLPKIELQIFSNGRFVTMYLRTCIDENDNTATWNGRLVYCVEYL